jgi:hypothetical protein
MTIGILITMRSVRSWQQWNHLLFHPVSVKWCTIETRSKHKRCLFRTNSPRIIVNFAAIYMSSSPRNLFPHFFLSKNGTRMRMMGLWQHWVPPCLMQMPHHRENWERLKMFILERQAFRRLLPLLLLVWVLSWGQLISSVRKAVRSWQQWDCCSVVPRTVKCQQTQINSECSIWVLFLS